jgi:alcohol dehydrogenase class IV
MTTTAPLQFRFSSLEQEIICAQDAISRIGDSLAKLGVERAMVVCGPTILASCNVVQRVQDALGQRYVGLYSGVAPHSPVETVQEAVALAKEMQPNVLVSVGGGSTHDTTKGIAMLLAEGGDIHDWEVIFEPPNRVTYPDTPHEKLPIVSVPTTMGGAELSRGGGGFTDKRLGRKILLSGQGTGHRVVIIDGEALATTPMRIQLATGIGQLRIAIESVYSTGHNPIGDALSLHAIGMLAEYLPRCPEGDIDVLLNTKTAAGCLPMLAMGAVGGLGLNTAIAHHVGGLYDVPHGEANAILLPHTMRFNLDASADRQKLIAEAMGVDTAGMTDEEAGMTASDAVARLCRALDLPETLRDVGVPEEGLEFIAAATLHDRGLATNPKPISDAGPVMEVLRRAW